MKTPLAFLVTLSAAAFAFASAEVDSLAKSAPGLDRYPQASAIHLFDRQIVTLDGDGRRYILHEFALKILDERARDTYGDQSIRFDADQDTVLIDIARTRLPDGTWIDPEPDAFTLTSAPEVQWASAYSQLKQRNISFPGLDVNAVIHLRYRIEPRSGSKLPRDPRSGGIVLFGGYEPVLEKTFSIVSPPAWKIQFELKNSDRKPAVGQQSGKTVHRWAFREMDQIIDEPNSVGLGDLVPRLLWTTFTSWDDLGLFVLERFLDKMDTAKLAIDGYHAVTAPNLSGVPAVMNTALWVQRNIRNVHLSFGAVGYEPNTADRVWQNRYGDPRDKAVLLSALLFSYGFESIPVLVTNSTVDFCNLPVLEQFTHIILAVPVENDTVWLDPTVEHYAPGELPFSRTYGKACVLAHGIPLVMKLAAGSVDRRSVSSTMNFTLSENGDLYGTVTCEPRGHFAARARATLKDQKEQERDIFVQRAVARFGQGTRSTSFSTSDPADVTGKFAVSLGIESPGYAVRQDDLLLVEVPANPLDFATSGFYPYLPEVKYPVALPAQGRTDIEIRMNIPSAYSISYVPPPLIIDNRYVHLELQAEPGQETIVWRYVAEIKADKVPVTDYRTVRQAYETFALPKNRLAILEQKRMP